MGSSFYRNSEACILVFDLTQSESFKNVEVWRNEFLNVLNPPDGSTYPFILIGNKCDLKDDIKVTNEEIEAYCKEHNNMPYFAASAKEDINLEEAFNKVADMAFIRNTKNEDLKICSCFNSGRYPSGPSLSVWYSYWRFLFLLLLLV